MPLARHPLRVNTFVITPARVYTDCIFYYRITIMSTVQIRVDEKLKKNAWQVFEKLNLSPSEALRLFLRYVAENEKLPFNELSVLVSDNDEDEDILNIVRKRLKNPARRIRVNIDDL